LPGLAALADLRCRPDIRVVVRADRAWVFWRAGQDEVLRRVFPVSGVALYAEQNGLWYQPGHHLPTFGIPGKLDQESVPLSQALVPAPAEITSPGRARPQAARLGLVRDDDARPASALRCRVSALSAWAEAIPSSRFGSLRAAIAGDLVMLLGLRLPSLGDGERYWGTDVLTPLGFRAEPNLPHDAIRRALGVAAEEILLLTGGGGYEVIPHHVFRPLTLAGIRLAERGRDG
jgi:hypothetical protein